MSKPIHAQVFLRDDVISALAALTLTAANASGESSDYARGFTTAISAVALNMGIQPQEVRTALEWSMKHNA